MKQKNADANRKKSKEVVVVLPYIGQNILMQLRDVNPIIDYPGHWGFFGGTVEPDEKPKETALRELWEELNFSPKKIYKLSTDYVPIPNNILSHAFFCSLTVPLKDLILSEGRDYGLFSLEEIESQKLYSQKLKKHLPVVPNVYMSYCVKKLFKQIQSNKPMR